MKLFHSEKETVYVPFPTLHPMGAYTFAIACMHCKNDGTDKCVECKKETQSGFEFDPNVIVFRKKEEKKLCLATGRPCSECIPGGPCAK